MAECYHDNPHSLTAAMRTSQASTASKPQLVNGLENTAIPTSHQPQPCRSSLLNKASVAEVQVPYNWPTHVVFVTQNLAAPTIPDHVAQVYILRPRDASDSNEADELPDSEEESDNSAAIPSAGVADGYLPRATHDPSLTAYYALYTTELSAKIPVHIHPIDRETPYCPASFHAKSRNLTCHPALGSYGLFAGDIIPPNTFLRPYLGVLHLKQDSDDRSEYDLTLTHDPRLPSLTTSDGDAPQPGQNIYIDSRHWANETRFINDYRGIADRPNVEFRSFLQRQPGADEKEQALKFQMGVWSVKPIKRGEELVINYSKTFWTQQHIVDQTAELVARLEAEASAEAERQRLAALATVDPIQARLDRARTRITQTRPPYRPPPRSQS